MTTHEVVVNGVTLPVNSIEIEQIGEEPLLGCEKNHLRVTANDAIVRTEDIGYLIESLMTETPRYPEDTVSLPERACLAFGGHFWDTPDLQMGDEPERRVCVGCDAEQKKVEKWIDADGGGSEKSSLEGFGSNETMWGK